MRCAFVAVVLGLTTGAFAASAEPKPRMNLIFLLADDLGWRDLGVYGSKFHRTPNIDRLASRGMLFTQAYSANPFCSPTRASILSGQFPARYRITVPGCHLKEEITKPIVPATAGPQVKVISPQSCTRFPLEYITLGEVLQQAGYQTAHLGKWHLGWPPFGPQSQGFQFVLPGGSYPGPPSYFAPFKMAGFADGPTGEHIDDRLTRHAIEFMEANRDRPFFLNYWLFSVHAPFQGKPELIDQYERRIDPQNPQQCATMGAMVDSMDTCVGRIVEAVDRLKLSDRTLIVFTSDNGGNMYDRVQGVPPTSNSPLRNGKGTIYEGGIRVPLLFIWPGVTQANSRSDTVVQSIDYFPTLLEALDVPRPSQLCDGVSLTPVLRKSAPIERDAIYCYFPHIGAKNAHQPACVVRQGDWKLIRFFFDGPDGKHRYELYNLKDDLGETKNLAEARPELVAKLDGLIDGHLKNVDALLPVPNPAYDPKRLPIDGWRPSADCRQQVRQGILTIESLGGDPGISAEQVPAAKGNLAIELRMRSTSQGAGHFYWTTHAAPKFNRQVRLDLNSKHDGQWHDYRVEFEAKSPLTGLRIDPSSAKGQIEIDWIRLRQGDATLKQWAFGE